MDDNNQVVESVETNVAPPVENLDFGDTAEESGAPSDELGFGDEPSPTEAAIEEIKAEESPDQKEEQKDEENVTNDTQKEEMSAKVSTEEEKSEEEVKETSSDVYKVTVNGKEEEVTLQDLKDGYSGQKEVQRRFSELDKERKEWQDEKSLVEGYIGDFRQRMESGNILSGLAYFAEFAGKPGYVVKEQLMAALEPEFRARMEMTPEELQNSLLKQENEFLSQRNESETHKRAEEQAKLQAENAEKELQASISQFRETHKLSEEEWNQAFDTLDKEVPADQDITVEMVQKRALEVQADSNASNLVTELTTDVEDLINDDFKAELKSLILRMPELTNEQLSQIVKDSLQDAEKKRLESSLKEKGAIKKKKTKEKPKANTSPIDDWGFGDDE